MRRARAGLFLLSVPVFGQILTPIPIFNPFHDLQNFLELTQSQIQRITENVASHERWVQGKQERIAEVQFEIGQETVKETVDPTALGLRYAEIEMICREIRTSEKEAGQANIAVLTDAQKAKLKALDDAVNCCPRSVRPSH